MENNCAVDFIFETLVMTIDYTHTYNIRTRLIGVTITTIAIITHSTKYKAIKIMQSVS